MALYKTVFVHTPHGIVRLKEADFSRVETELFFRKKVLNQSQSRQLSRGGLFSSFLEQLGFVVYEKFYRQYFLRKYRLGILFFWNSEIFENRKSSLI